MSQPIDLNRRGMLFVLSSPSGAGKSTIARRLLGEDAGLELSVSATTRPSIRSDSSAATSKSSNAAAMSPGGRSRPRRSTQRSSASNPTTRPVERSTLGW